MKQMPLLSSVRWTVTTLTAYMRELFETDEMLRDVWVQGEISNFSHPRSGHIYFTLKDGGASLRGVMWRTSATRLTFDLRDGMAVEAHGHISIYDVGGQYQLYADEIRPVGEGVLYQEFLRLKAMLEAEGLFDAERKRPIPQRPRRIGIVTSATGAALRDMLNTMRRRFPLAEVVIAPTMVQGDAAPPKIVAALDGLNRDVRDLDVILIARGGGSIEDLWAFNDERVVRAVAASPIPVISGVGHETDFTLTDFVADLRAATPTAAAELATPLTMDDLYGAIVYYGEQLRGQIDNILDDEHVAVDDLQMRLKYVSPLRHIQQDGQRLDELTRRLNATLAHRLDLTRANVGGFARRLETLNPQAVLARGYAVVTRKKDQKIIGSVDDINPGDDLNIRVSDGTFDAKV